MPSRVYFRPTQPGVRTTPGPAPSPPGAVSDACDGVAGSVTGGGSGGGDATAGAGGEAGGSDFGSGPWPPQVRTAWARANAGAQTTTSARMGGPSRTRGGILSHVAPSILRGVRLPTGGRALEGLEGERRLVRRRHARVRAEVQLEALRGVDLGHEEGVGRARRVAVREAPGHALAGRLLHRALEGGEPAAHVVMQPRLLSLRVLPDPLEGLEDAQVLERLRTAVDDLDERADPGAPVRIPRI